jgi:membrane protein
MISRIAHFFKAGVWEIRLKDLPSIKAFLVRALRILLLASRRFVTDRCQQTASVLTYYSLLNIVPVVAVAFAIAKGFGLERLIEKQITQIAAKANWQSGLTNQILTFSHNLLGQAKGGLIAGVGIVLLFWTVISILGKIEESLNDIWEIKKSRTLIRKFGDYIAMMVLLPLLLVISGSATLLVASQVTVLLAKISFLGVFSSVVLFVLDLLPYVSIWVLLTMLYLIMPNTRIPLGSAILGGIAGGTIAQVVQWAYIKFQIGVASQGAIYGSFAALPLFLAWLQMSWMIVLFGAEIAHAGEHYETYGFHPDYSRISVSAKKLLTLRIFHLLTKRFSLGEKPMTVRQIARAVEIPVRLVESLLQELSEVGLVGEMVKGETSEVGFQPGRTIETITLKFVLDEYEKYGVTEIPDYRSDDVDTIAKYLKDISETIEKSPGNVRIKDI